MTDLRIEESTTGEAGMGDYFALLKPRVMSLVVFTAIAGMLVAPVSINPFIGFVAILCIAVGAGASGALNMWWDADIDAIMKRTAKRPIPAGKVAPHEALGLGLSLSAFSVVLLWLATNWLAAGLLAFTIFFYATVYSMWLKRATPQNIVIGGAAGAFPPMIGWAAATGDVTLSSVLMFALIFMWTPPHFWALALFVKTDYGDAGVPMLTETHGRRVTRNYVLGYTILLIPTALALGFTPIGGPVYLAASVILNIRFLLGVIALWQRDEVQADADKYAVEKRVFRISLSYLFLHFGALLAEALLRANGLGGW